MIRELATHRSDAVLGAVNVVSTFAIAALIRDGAITASAPGTVVVLVYHSAIIEGAMESDPRPAALGAWT